MSDETEIEIHHVPSIHQLGIPLVMLFMGVGKPAESDESHVFLTFTSMMGGQFVWALDNDELDRFKEALEKNVDEAREALNNPDKHYEAELQRMLRDEQA